MKAKFREEMGVIREICEEISTEYGLARYSGSGTRFNGFGIYGQDGSVTIEYPTPQPIMAVIGLLARRGKESLESVSW